MELDLQAVLDWLKSSQGREGAGTTCKPICRLYVAYKAVSFACYIELNAIVRITFVGLEL